jgi:hypothetical protein
MKVNVIMWTVLTIMIMIRREIDLWILAFLGNFTLALVAWYVTKRHSWTTDFFALLFSISLCLEITLMNFGVEDWLDIEEDDMTLRNNCILIFF